MKLSQLTSIIIVAFIALIFTSGTQAQVNNRLPRRAIIGAMQNAMQDTTGSKLKPFVCKPNTKSITIEVTNLSVPEDRPYIITADSLGITLEIFRGDEHVYNEFFQYRGSNFAKIMAKVKSAKLKKVKAHGVMLDGGNSTVLSFQNARGTYFSLSDNSGSMDYEGDFDGVITEITRQIPNFQAIICKDYESPNSLKADEVKINGAVCNFVTPNEISGIITVDTSSPTIVALNDQDATLSLSWLTSSGLDVKVIALRKFKGKKKKTEFYGFSFENIVKDALKPDSYVSKGDKTIAKYSIKDKTAYYALYDTKSGNVIVIQIDDNDAVG